MFGCQAFPCQSLTFINGSTQDAHQDTIHLTPFPRGLVCGVWVALEDVVPGSGELFYYPGSYRLPAVLCSSHGVPKVDSEDGDYNKFGAVFTPAIKKLLADNAYLCPQTFLPRAGDVLIWQENLIHGGSPRKIMDQTRMSMVIHAFAEPALVYYDSTGISGKRDVNVG
nr:phytanoyl-CoA dioxygenase family protein [Synechococcus sp. EJ6-Ellesmere]